MIQMSFDYSVFDQDTTIFLQETEDKIVGRTQRWIKDTGRDLLEAKTRIGHGHFVDWIRARFDMSEDTAQNLMNVTRNFGEIPNGSVFADRALYLLSRKSTSEDARQEAKDRAVSGEEITFDVAKEIVETKKALKREQEARIEAEKKAGDIQTQLSLFQSHSQLAQAKIDALQEQIETIQKPDAIEIMPPEAVDRIAKLETELKEMTERRNNLAEIRTKLSEELNATRDANKARREQEMYEHKVNSRVIKYTDSLGREMNQFLGSVPSPFETEVLTGDSWQRLENTERMARRVLDEIAEVKKYGGRILESSAVSAITIIDAN
jgi:hypothetical protein